MNAGRIPHLCRPNTKLACKLKLEQWWNWYGITEFHPLWWWFLQMEYSRLIPNAIPMPYPCSMPLDITLPNTLVSTFPGFPLSLHLQFRLLFYKGQHWVFTLLVSLHLLQVFIQSQGLQQLICMAILICTTLAERGRAQNVKHLYLSHNKHNHSQTLLKDNAPCTATA